MSGLLALLLVLLAPAAADEVARSVKQGDLTAVVLRAADGSEKFHVYAQRAKKRALVYLHPGAERFELLDAPKGLPVFLYRATLAGRATLHALRVDGLRVRQAGRFPEGRPQDVDGDGRLEIVSRERPLGRFLAADCESVHAASDKAVRTAVWSWGDETFEEASASFPAYFEAAIARIEENLPDMKPADRLGSALALYYDHAAKGDKRLGWERLLELLSARSAAPGVTACARRIKEGLREKLEIPADWP